MQIRLFKNYADIERRLQFLDKSGVSACSHAIQEIISRRHISQVVLMGDCAEANISFNTALVDARVMGLILTNPNVAALLANLTVVDRLPLRLFSATAWRRLLAGDSKLFKSWLRRLGSQAAERWLAAQRSFRKDIVLPKNFEHKLGSLLRERAVRSLMLFSKDRDALRFLRKSYGETLDELRDLGRLTVEVLPLDARDDPADEQAPCPLADLVAEWVGRVLVDAGPGPVATPVAAESAPLPDWALHASISERFGAMARLFPDRVAVRDQARTLTYAQLAAQSRRIAAAITTATLDPGPVAVLLANEARCAAAILGVWAAGRACVPLDADHPAERNGRIAAHSGASCVICSAALAASARTMFPSGLRLIDLDALDATDSCARSILPDADDIACVIYTSGSTGTPKGVFQNHRGLLRDVMESVSFAQISGNDRIALFYPPSVIAGLRTLLTGLMSGAALEVLPPLKFGRTALAGLIEAHGITILRLSPTLFRHLAHSLPAGGCFDSVRWVALGGERVDWGDVDLFRSVCAPHAELCVHLGATECWTLHTEWRVDASVRAAYPRLPVGRAIDGRRVDVLGEDGAPRPEGEIGEAVISSRYIALGYWREPELTAQVFTVDPIDPRQRSYRTGDLVRRGADGLVEFIGRKDNQIKLHGYRIEPDEVEAALKTCSGVSDAAVVVRKNTAGVPTALAGYVQLQRGARAESPDHIRAMLSGRVPPYMMPAEIAVLDELPWMANFKVDHQRLAQIDAARLNDRSRTESSPLIGELIETFEQVTRASGATASDNILSLGGDSLQALELMLEIARRFRVVVPDEAQDPTRTIAQWARDIAAWQGAQATCSAE